MTMEEAPACKQRADSVHCSFSVSVQEDGAVGGEADVRRPSGSFHDRQATISTTSSSTLTLNLITGGLGTGILSLPWSTAGATIVPALVTIAIVLALNAWTIMVLVRAAERFQTFDLGGLLAHLPGARRAFVMQAVCNATVWMSMFLCLVGYLVAIVDSADRALGEDHVNRVLLVGVAAVLVLPLCFLSQEKLAFTSSLTVGVNIYIFILLAVLMGQEAAAGDLETPCFLNVGRGTVAMVTAMMQSVIIQMCVLPMYEELEDRTPEKFSKVVLVAFSALFLLFSLFSVAGQTLYGLDVKSNILKNLPRDTAGMVAQCGTVVAIAGVYPIMLMPMVAPLRSSRFHATVKPVTVAIVLASLLIASVCNDLGFLNVINGALCVGVFVGLVPSLVGVMLLGMKKLPLILLSVVCVAMSVLGFMYTQNYAEDNAVGNCLWYGF